MLQRWLIEFMLYGAALGLYFAERSEDQARIRQARHDLREWRRQRDDWRVRQRIREIL